MPEQAFDKKAFYKERHLALLGRRVVPVEGSITNKKGKLIADELGRLAMESHRREIILLVDSDGGAMTGGQLALTQIMLLNGKGVPITSIAVGDVASAGLDIFMMAPMRYAYPSASFNAHTAWFTKAQVSVKDFELFGEFIMKSVLESVRMRVRELPQGTDATAISAVIDELQRQPDEAIRRMMVADGLPVEDVIRAVFCQEFSIREMIAKGRKRILSQVRRMMHDEVSMTPIDMLKREWVDAVIDTATDEDIKKLGSAITSDVPPIVRRWRDGRVDICPDQYILLGNNPSPLLFEER